MEKVTDAYIFIHNVYLESALEKYTYYHRKQWDTIRVFLDAYFGAYAFYAPKYAYKKHHVNLAYYGMEVWQGSPNNLVEREDLLEEYNSVHMDPYKTDVIKPPA